MSVRKLEDVHRQAIADGMVKIGIPTTDMDGVEWCFAQRVSQSHAKLVNVPVFNPDVHYGDVVEFREEHPPHVLLKQFVRVKTQGSVTVPFWIASSREARTMSARALLDRAQRMREYLLAAPLHVRPLDVMYVADHWMIGAWVMTVDHDALWELIDAFE